MSRVSTDINTELQKLAPQLVGWLKDQTDHITAKEIAAKFGIHRRWVADLARLCNDQGEPVCSSTIGYFYAHTADEIEEYARFYRSRMIPMYTHLKAIKRLLKRKRNLEKVPPAPISDQNGQYEFFPGATA